MIEITIILISIVSLILFKIYMLPKEIEIITTGLIIGGICFYISRNIADYYFSLAFLILGILSILMILILEIFFYINKIM